MKFIDRFFVYKIKIMRFPSNEKGTACSNDLTKIVFIKIVNN